MKLNAIMTAMDIRTSINNGLAGFTPDMLLVVDDFVKSLRRRMVEPHKARLWDPETGEYLNDETMALVERVRNGEEPMHQLDSMEDFFKEIMDAEERAYWAQSVERDLADIASGKPRKYVSGDEFWSRFEEAVETVFVDKIMPSAMMTH